MLIIGELINGMYKTIGAAIREKNRAVIQQCAKAQVAAGAHALDVNCGPASANPVEDIQWLVNTVQEATVVPLCVDSGKPAVIEAALKLLKRPGIINSTTADREKLDVLIPLAKQYKAGLIGIAISAKGIPQNKDQRLELAAAIVTACSEQDFSTDKLYLDPIVMPVNVAQAQMKDILDTIHEFKIIADPAPKTVIGLSNVSQGTCSRKLINRTFLTMALASGLDAAILDPSDKDLMDSVITSELVLNHYIYCDSYLDAYRRR